MNWIVYVIQRTIHIRYCESLWVEILTVLAVGHSRLVTEHTLLSFDSFILDVEQHIARSVNRERERSVKPLWLRVMGYGLWAMAARCSVLGRARPSNAEESWTVFTIRAW